MSTFLEMDCGGEMVKFSHVDNHHDLVRSERAQRL